MDPERLAAIAGKHGIRLLLQFGSTVTGSVHAHSDLDLAVLLEQPPGTLGGYSDLLADLQALAPGQEVDLAILNHADPLFLKQITGHAARLYGSDRTLAQLKLYAWKRYLDHRRFLDMERAYVARKIEALAR